MILVNKGVVALKMEILMRQPFYNVIQPGFSLKTAFVMYINDAKMMH